MRRLYRDDDYPTELAASLERRVWDALEPIFQQAVAANVSIKDLSYLVSSIVKRMENNTLFRMRLKELLATEPLNKKEKNDE